VEVERGEISSFIGRVVFPVLSVLLVPFFFSHCLKKLLEPFIVIFGFYYPA
jgi:hypothetical protein